MSNRQFEIPTSNVDRDVVNGMSVPRRSVIRRMVGLAALVGNVAMGADDPRRGSSLARGSQNPVESARQPFRAYQLAQHDSVNAIAFSPDGATLAVGCGRMADRTRYLGGIVNIWDLATRKQVGQLKGHKASCESLAISPDGKTLASGGDSRDILMWNLADRRLVASPGGQVSTYTNERPRVRRLCFSPDGMELASLDDLRQVRRTDISGNGREMAPYRMKLRSEIVDIVYSLKGSLEVLACETPPKFENIDQGLLTDNIDLGVWCPPGNRPIWARRQPYGCIAGVFSTDGTQLAVLARPQHQHGFHPELGDQGKPEVPILNAKTGQLLARWVSPLPLRCLRFSPDGTRLAVSSSNNGPEKQIFIALLDAKTGDLLGSVDTPHGPSCMEFSPDGRYLATNENSETVTIHKVADIIDINP